MRPIGRRILLGVSVVALAAAAPMLGYGPSYFGIKLPGLTGKASVEHAAAPAKSPAAKPEAPASVATAAPTTNPLSLKRRSPKTLRRPRFQRLFRRPPPI